MDFCQLVAHFLWTHTSTAVLRQGVPNVHFLLYGGPPCSPYFEPGFYYKGSISDDSEQVLLISLFPVTCRPLVDLCLFSIILSLSQLESTWLLPLLPWPSPPWTHTNAPSSCGSTSSLNPGWDIHMCPGLSPGWEQLVLGCPWWRRIWKPGWPSTDRVLTDWMQSHHVWAGLIDRLRWRSRSRVRPESLVRSSQRQRPETDTPTAYVQQKPKAN